MMDVKNLNKDYTVKQKGAGLSGALKGLVTRNTEVVHAVKNLSFHIDEGEIVGFIGPNGAGKSTTIKMMSGILTPTSGSVLIGGEDIAKHRKEVVRNIGVVFVVIAGINLRVHQPFRISKHGNHHAGIARFQRIQPCQRRIELWRTSRIENHHVLL